MKSAASIITINATNIKTYLGLYTISNIVYEWLNTVPKSPAEATKRYNYQKMIRRAIEEHKRPKATILMTCREIARDHKFCEEIIKKTGKCSRKVWEFDWDTYYTKEEAPMWGNYNEEGKTNLEEAMGYMLYNKMKPYLIDNKKSMLCDRCI